MMRATLLAACAALFLISLACFAIGGGTGDRPSVSPTADLQATINAALAKLGATKTVTAGEPAPTDMPQTPLPRTRLKAQPATPILAATLSPATTAAATATRSPTATPTAFPSPSPTRTPTFAPVASPPDVERQINGPELEKEIHQLINAERVTRGVTALDWDDRIAKIARDHSEDMAANDYFRHDNLKGQSPTDRGNSAGYPCRKELGGGGYSYGLGENIWHGWEYSSYTFGVGVNRYEWMSQAQLAQQAVSSWMGSAGHRQNILDSQYDRTGIGVGLGSSKGKPYAVYLTQNFC